MREARICQRAKCSGTPFVPNNLWQSAHNAIVAMCFFHSCQVVDFQSNFHSLKLLLPQEIDFFKFGTPFSLVFASILPHVSRTAHQHLKDLMQLVVFIKNKSKQFRQVGNTNNSGKAPASPFKLLAHCGQSRQTGNITLKIFPRGINLFASTSFHGRICYNAKYVKVCRRYIMHRDFNTDTLVGSISLACTQSASALYLGHGVSTVKPAVGYAWMEANAMRRSECVYRIEHIDRQGDPALIMVTQKDTMKKLPLPPLPPLSDPPTEPPIPRT